MKSVPFPINDLTKLGTRLASRAAPRDVDNNILLEQVIEGLGLTCPENAVFSTLLKLGTRQAAAIAKATGMNRSHVYEVLSRLHSRELITIHERDKTKYFTCIPLEDLMMHLSRQEARLAEQRVQLGELIQNLQFSRPDYFCDPQTKSFRGPEVRGRLFQELISEDSQFLLAFCSAKESLLFEGIAPTLESLQQLNFLVPTPLYTVLHSSTQDTIEMVTDLNDLRVMAIHEEFPADLIVSQHRVTILGTKGNKPYGLTIEQPAVAQAILLFGFSVLSRLNGTENEYWKNMLRNKIDECSETEAA